MSDDDTMSALWADLADKLEAFLGYCDENDLVRPYIFVLANRDGAVFAARFREGRKVTILAEPETGTMLLPNVGMLLDQSGMALKIVVDEDGIKHESVAAVLRLAHGRDR